LNIKIGKVFTSKFVGTGPSSFEKRIYRAAVSQKLIYTALKGQAVAQLVEALRYKAEGCGFDFSLT
jgi:hypothetical protein